MSKRTERRVIYIDVGHLSSDKASEHMARMMKILKACKTQ